MAFPTLPVLLIGLAVLLILGITITAVSIASTQDAVGERLQVYAYLPDELQARKGSRRNTQLTRLRLRINMMLANIASEELNLQLNSANWPVTVIEFILIRIGAMIAGLLLGWFLSGSFISGLAIAVVAFLIPGMLLKRSIHKRQQLFEKQLIDVLVLLNGAVRGGFSLLQAIEVVVKEMSAPVNEEFQKVLREVGLGLSLTAALQNLSNRMKNQDFDLLVTAVSIHAQVGGNLTVMLGAVTETIRERIRLFGEVRVITTQQRYTSYFLSLMPFIIAAIIFFINPDHLKNLFDQRIICIPIGSLIGIILGHLAIQRLAKIEI